MSKYYPPTHFGKQFHCILCKVYAKQHWSRLYAMRQNALENSPFHYCVCDHCSGICYWYEERMIVPSAAPVAPPHEDMPADCVPDFDEARDIVARSPKAAAALMRLVVQKLMVALGMPGKNINDDIGTLVQAGLPPMVQQALDYCRVVGNNAVHPGEITVDDNPEIAYALFEMVNLVVDDRIARPKQVAALFAKLPDGAKQAIERRDAA